MSDASGRHRAEEPQPSDGPPQRPAQQPAPPVQQPEQPWQVPGYQHEQPLYQPIGTAAPSPPPYPPPYPPPPGAALPPYPTGYPGVAAPPWQASARQVWAPESPPTPRRRGRLRVAAIVAAAVAAVVVVGAIVVGIVMGSGNSQPSFRVTLPAAFAGYTQLHNAISDRVEHAIREYAQSAGIGAAFDADATIGSYSHNTGDQPVLVALVLPTKAAATTPGESSHGIVSDMLAGTGADAHSYPPGPHGGSAVCGIATFGAAHETVCAWSDRQLTGILYSVNEGKRTADMATLTRTFRDRIE